MTVMSSLAPLFAPDATRGLKSTFRDRLWKQAQHGWSVLCHDGLAEQAIDTLRDQETDMDARDWAERYLVGMTDLPQKEFTVNRRAQS